MDQDEKLDTLVWYGGALVLASRVQSLSANCMRFIDPSERWDNDPTYNLRSSRYGRSIHNKRRFTTREKE